MMCPDEEGIDTPASPNGTEARQFGPSAAQGRARQQAADWPVNWAAVELTNGELHAIRSDPILLPMTTFYRQGHPVPSPLYYPGTKDRHPSPKRERGDAAEAPRGVGRLAMPRPSASLALRAGELLSCRGNSETESMVTEQEESIRRRCWRWTRQDRAGAAPTIRRW
jgi:hypothetical protein